MMTILIITLVLVWLFIGAFGFYYNWTREYNISKSDLMVMTLCAIAGPIGLFCTWAAMIESDYKIIFKKRENRNGKE